MAMELGGFAPFLYGMEAASSSGICIGELTGARVTTSFGRIGGVERDLPEGWVQRVKDSLVKVEEFRQEIDTLLTLNRMFIDRTKGTGVINAEDAVDFGFTGPMLRASGVDYDIRKAHPYSGLDSAAVPRTARDAGR